VILVDMAQEALDSAKSAHHRIDTLEAEVRDIRGLTAAMATVNEKVDNLKSDMDEIKSDVKAITDRPGQWWDKIIAAAIGAISTGIVAAILNVILK
jgi:TPP-dependent trihydroxycyclohexane-1,2-dione (THcHDO) dehydratase